MRIFKAITKDLDAIVELHKQFEVVGSPDYKWMQRRWIRDNVNYGSFYVIKEKGDVFAAMCLHLDLYKLPGEAYIETLAAREDMHKQGLGKRLVEFAKRKAKKEGKTLLTVDSAFKFNVKDFYQNCGFKLFEIGDPEGEIPFYKFRMEL